MQKKDYFNKCLSDRQLHSRRILKIKIYSALATIFWLVRQFAIPNPFEALGEGIIISLGDAPFTLTPEILNWIADPIIFSVTFFIVGLYYRKGSAPALGSFLYMFFYCVHIVLLYWVLSVYPTVWQMVLIVCGYIALHITAKIIKWKMF